MTRRRSTRFNRQTLGVAPFGVLVLHTLVDIVAESGHLQQLVGTLEATELLDCLGELMESAVTEQFTSRDWDGCCWWGLRGGRDIRRGRRSVLWRSELLVRRISILDVSNRLEVEAYNKGQWKE